MPLSEHEQRLLEEMERSLYHNDADFVATVGNRGGRRNYRTIVLGVLVALVGVGIVITGVALSIAVIGIVGFVAMLGGVLLAISTPKISGDAPIPDAPRATSRPGFMDRLNERWDKRQDDQEQQ